MYFVLIVTTHNCSFSYSPTSFNETDFKTEFNSSTLQPLKRSILYSGWVDWKFVCGNRVKLNWMAFIALENWLRKEREREGFLVAFNIVSCHTALQTSHVDRPNTYAGAGCGCINCFETWEMELSILITLELGIQVPSMKLF